MKERTVTLRPALGPVVALEAIAITAFAALPPWRFSWWPFAVITAVAIPLLLVTVHRRNFAVWVAARIRQPVARRRTTEAGAAIDIAHGSSIYGVRPAGNEAVTVIRVYGRVYAPTFLRGSALALTTNVLPLEVLTEHLDQPGGLRLGVDVVSDGFRVRPESGYAQLYSTVLADRGAAGQRTTLLIARLEISESLAGLMYRQSIGTAAAAASDRIIKAFQQLGVRAVPLSAQEQDDVLAKLSLGLATPPPRPAIIDPADDIEDDTTDTGAAQVNTSKNSQDGATPAKIRPTVDVGWSRINAQPGYKTSYYFSPEDITTSTFNQMWALPSDDVLHVLMLRKIRGQVMVSALVRTNNPRPPEEAPTLYLNTLPGDQYAAALRVAPTSAPPLRLPACPLPAKLAITVGTTGVLVGASLQDDPHGDPEIRHDDLVMLALTDPQRSTRIRMDTSDFYVRQLLIRAAATGERIAVYSRDPRRWYSLSQPHIAIVERGRPAEFVPTIVVNDHADTVAPVGLAATVISIGETSDSAPDIVFQQDSPNTVQLRTTNGQVLRLGIVEFREEQVWTGTAA